MESEYVAACQASNEAMWLKKFVIELGVFPSCTDPVGIFCDNTGAIANAKEPRTHSTTKHILLKFHVTRDYVRDGHTRIQKIHTDLNAADPMTKPLPQGKLRNTARLSVLDTYQMYTSVICTLVQVGDCWICALEAN